MMLFEVVKVLKPLRTFFYKLNLNRKRRLAEICIRKGKAYFYHNKGYCLGVESAIVKNVILPDNQSCFLKSPIPDIIR